PQRSSQSPQPGEAMDRSIVLDLGNSRASQSEDDASAPISIRVSTSPDATAKTKGSRARERPSLPTNRAAQSRDLQAKVSRFLATAIGLWGLFSWTPGALAWQNWVTDFSATILPLWVPASLVLAGLPLLLGLLLFQIPEWASLQATAAGLLVIASVYGFAASLFAFAQPDSGWLTALGFPLSETKRATVWCLAMATLAGLLSFGCFREGQRWRRIGELLSQLFPGSEREPTSSG
ncbi:MAG: hypothetical protein ACK53V_19085, partial [Planctomycetota bacterium]